MRALLLMALAAGAAALAAAADAQPALSDKRLVLQTTLGDIELAFFPDVAPVTVAHMIELGRLGAFNTNHFFRVDRGFVAQVRRCQARCRVWAGCGGAGACGGVDGRRAARLRTGGGRGGRP